MSDYKNPLWYKDAVFYELYVRAFKDSNGDGHGDLRGLLSKLDYLQALGVDCIWLLPIYPSPLVDDGYDVADYHNIHEHFGTLDDFKALLEGVHARGMYLIVDVIINHTSDQHPWFIESRSSRDSPKRNWYVWSSTEERYGDARVIFVDTEDSNWAWDETTGEYYWHRFYRQQPDLNYDNPEVRQAMLDILDYWIEIGVDGFRVDAAPYLFERENTNCENLNETHAYIKQMRAHLDGKWPGRIMLAEANQWPEDVRAYFGDSDEFQMAFHFPIMPRLFMALKQRTRQSIVDIMTRTPAIPSLAQWCVFLRNHDELTLEMVTEAERQYMWEQYAPEPRMRLNLGIRRRLAPLLDNDMRQIKLLNALLFTLPGAPIIYYGDEIGMGDDIWRHDRNGVRTPMQWDSSQNAGFSDAEQVYEAVIDDESFGFQQINVAQQQANPDSLWYAIRHMLLIRKQYRAFGRGSFEFVLPDNDGILGYWRVYHDTSGTQDEESDESGGQELERFLIIVNLTGETQPVTLDLSARAGSCPVDVLTGEAWAQIQTEPYTFDLDPYAYYWLRV
jgi:maltose alpha-D-glucosyltransferase/alpha-amylase